MDEIKIIIKLRTYRISKFPILTVYLGCADKRTPKPDFCVSQFHSLIHRSSSEQDRRFWQKDIARIEDYLHQSFNRSNTRSLVFFSADKNLWEVLRFEFFLPPLIKLSHSPYLEPIEKALEQYKKYLVLLVDREKARLFTVRLGKIEERKDIFNNLVPQKVKAKKIDYGRDDKILRHIENYDLREHLKLIVNKTKGFVRGKNIHFIILGGHRELLPKIKNFLPYPLDKMVAGEFVTELNIPLNKVLSLSKKIAGQINREQ